VIYTSHQIFVIRGDRIKNNAVVEALARRETRRGAYRVLVRKPEGKE